ncbi:hypothetical protein EVJ58_g10668, partial [Rhodofomes roseus]
MDSYKIALYLDETYPDTPALLPPESRVFQTSFQHALGDVLHTRVVPLLLHQIAKPLNPRSRDYFIETREAFLGCKLEELSPPGSEKNAAQWVAMEKAFGVVASWIESAGDGRLLLSGGGPDGEDGKVTHADTDLAGVLIAMRVLLGVDSKEWERIEGFDEAVDLNIQVYRVQHNRAQYRSNIQSGLRLDQVSRLGHCNTVPVEMATSETDVIILYDIPSTVPGNAWSANTWKTRFALNYKGIPYRTQWVEYPDIAPLLTSLGVSPNTPSTWTFPYTLPAIYDPRTRTVLMDSIKIARYLDETYPDTPA